MNVLLTGASGFVGSRIFDELIKQHRVTTLGRTPVERLSVHHRHVYCDLAEGVPTLPDEPFDLVVHSAGKAHSIPRTAAEGLDYEQVNVRGTARLLAALAHPSARPQAIVYISTVLVYGCREGYLLDESTPLNARDAYGLSKVRAEATVREWGVQTGTRTTILRLPMVVDREPTGNLAAMRTALRRGYYVRIGAASGEPPARRSMVRADDVAAVIVRAAQTGGIFNLTDGRHPTVHELEDGLARQVGRAWIPTVPLPLARAVAAIGDGINAIAGRRFPLDSPALHKLTHSLTFADDAARQRLNWNPRSVLDLFP